MKVKLKHQSEWQRIILWNTLPLPPLKRRYLRRKCYREERNLSPELIFHKTHPVVQWSYYTGFELYYICGIKIISLRHSEREGFTKLSVIGK